MLYRIKVSHCRMLCTIHSKYEYAKLFIIFIHNDVVLVTSVIFSYFSALTLKLLFSFNSKNIIILKEQITLDQKMRKCCNEFFCLGNTEMKQ